MMNKKYFYLIFALVPHAAFGLYKKTAGAGAAAAKAVAPIAQLGFDIRDITSKWDLIPFAGYMVAYQAKSADSYFTEKDNYTKESTLGDMWYGLMVAHPAHKDVIELLPVLRHTRPLMKTRTIPLGNDLIQKTSLKMRRATAKEIAGIVAAIKEKQAQIPFATLAQNDAIEALVNPPSTGEKKASEGAGAAKD